MTVRGRWRAGLLSALVVVVSGALVLPQPSSAGPSGPVPAPPGTRATWLWDDAPAAEVVDWAVAAGVTEVFVHVASSVLTDGSLARLQDLRLRAGTRIRLTALGGDPTWTTDHAAALAWLRAVVATGLFAGVHVDVEPYLTPGWSGDPAGTRAAFLRLLDRLRGASPLPLEADVPFWYGQYRAGRANFADEVLRRVHAVTVMSYRDTGAGPGSILAVGADWLARGAAAGRRVRLAAETGPLPDCGYCTFAEEGRAALTRELERVDAGTRQAAAFNGVAVHWYRSWRTLGP